MAGCLRGQGIGSDCGAGEAGEAAREGERFTDFFPVQE